MKLSDRVALVTGGTRGIGRAIVERFAQEGARVATCARQIADTEQFSLGDVLVVKADVTRVEDVESLVSTVLEQWGRIDIVVNNAGITRDSLLLRMSDQQWQQVLDINLTGTFNVCRAVIKHMMKQRSGHIVNISSVIGVTGNPGQINYAASKAGIIGLTKSLAREVASRGILVNCIAPGYIATDMTEELTEQQKERIVANIPLSRTGKVEDVAEAVLFLAADTNKYITGQVLNVDGGLVI